MQGIEVPAAYRHMLPRKYGTTEDYKPSLRNLIEKNKGKVLKGSDFEQALGISTAGSHVKKLMHQGYIRHRAKSKTGKAYTYKWNSIPLDPKTATLAAGEVITRSLDLPPYPLDFQSLQNISNLFIEWFDKQQPSAEQAAGALIFRKYLEDKYKEVDDQRTKKLAGEQ